VKATSEDPRYSTQFESSMMAAAKASWFSLILNSREGRKCKGDGLPQFTLFAGIKVTFGK